MTEDRPSVGGSSSGGGWGGLGNLLTTIIGGSYSNGTYTNTSGNEAILSPEMVAENKRTSLLSGYTPYKGSTLSSFDMTGYGINAGSINENGDLVGNSGMIYDNGQLLVKSDMISQFYSIFAAQNKSAQAKSMQFLGQDATMLSGGAKASQKGTILGGVV